MNQPMDDLMLPELPGPEELGMDFDKGWDGVRAYGFTETQMREYAKQAVEADRATRLAAPQPAQPEQEPVAWGVDWGKAGDVPCVSIIKRLADGGIEVLAVEYGPQQPAQQPLTDEMVWQMWVDSPSDVLRFARAIEAAHGIKEQNHV